jgi:hypothetical protein
MNSAFDCRVTIELGSHRRVVTLAELARALGLPDQAGKIGSVLFAAACPEPIHTSTGEREPTESMGLPPSPETKNERYQKLYSSFPLAGKGGESEGNHRGQEAERLAAYLADRLDDWKSHRFFLSIARSVPHEVVLAALASALDVPRADVRRSRAAYFTAVIRRYLAGRASS